MSADCYVGATTGAFKLINLKEERFTNAQPLEKLKPKEHGIVGMCFVDNSQTEVLTLQKNGDVNFYNTVTGDYTKLFETENTEAGGPAKAIQLTVNDRIVVAHENGHVQIYNQEGSPQIGDGFEAGANLNFLITDPNNREVALTGGKENTLKLWDLERKATLWSMKNLKDDYLSLRIPIWEANGRFVKDSKLICTTTGHHQIRLFDPKRQRKPVISLDWHENPIRAISTCHREEHVIAGNNCGELALFDLRGKIRPVHKFRGGSGAIRCIDAHPTEKLVASVGIDRFLLVHDVDTKRTLHKIYLKTQLSSVLFSKVNSLTNPIKDEEPEVVTKFFEG
ncbi:unnamed protein product [Bursaphelenchus xylophilus]|uniref:(pine wood nematode) hypothetical protein n=1 Tax=Bursaphelenchus xylophilus TaxID=6326 RepID=A0A1I7RUA0_BURXY|nr:unnamed protein product [Bursaphelenchus xylophilus]CAG9113968.1 unnamed protein product [Bursaphelenchus xylophilus]